MTDSYRKSQAAFYDKYETALNTKRKLNSGRKNSYEIIKWKLRLEKSTQTAYQFTSCTSILGHTPYDGTICRRN
jgi:hypothetical protein